MDCTTHYPSEIVFSLFPCPAGLAILPNLLRYQGLEVYYYVYALDASHLL